VQHRNPCPAEVDEIAKLYDMRKTVFFRDPDRPDPKFVRPRRIVRTIDVIRAKGRARTAAWRAENDKTKRATLEQIGKSLCVALVTSNLDELTDRERSLVGRMLIDLQERGFNIIESRNTLKRLQKRLLGPVDSRGNGDDGRADHTVGVGTAESTCQRKIVNAC
jgi:hypothetical protein